MTALGRSLEYALKNVDVNAYLPLDDIIPVEPSKFYLSFGYLSHPLTRKPVSELAPYQVDVWNALLKYKRVLAIKSNKIGLTTSTLLMHLQLALLPSTNSLSTKGFDTLIIAQTKQHALEHIRTLRKLISESPRYGKYLVQKAVEQEDITSVIMSEKTKDSVIYIRNNEHETKPSRIIGLGLDNAGALASWKNVKALHLSDATQAIGDITDALNNALSRLANTDGTAIIETIPCPPQGPIYDMWLRYRAKTDLNRGDFKVFDISVEPAIRAGVVSQAFIDAERDRDPVNFHRNYMAKFSSVFGNVFSSDVIDKAIELGKQLEIKYGLEPGTSTEKSQGIDEGFGTSKFGVCVVQMVDGMLQVIMADEHERPAIDQEIYDAAARIKSWPIHTTQCDAAQPAFIAGLKRKIGEDSHYEIISKERHKFMKVKPIAFGTSHKAMLGNVLYWMEKGKIAIHPKFDKLLTSLRTAIAEDYSLDKDKTVNNDVFDAFRLAIEPYEAKGR